MATVADAQRAKQTLTNMQAILYGFLDEQSKDVFTIKTMKPVVALAKKRHSRVSNAIMRLERRIANTKLGG